MKNLKDIHYDAFISYRHLEPDSFVAQTLHKRLEAFSLPRSARDKAGSVKTKIERIFRDEEELPLSEDLSEPIDNALTNSEFLICICTPRYLESKWCMREIEIFLQTHDRDHILVVLAEGEPEESFPELLTQGGREPLAADTRGETKKEIISKIDTAVLRISAAIFGLNFDELKQRHREAKLKHLMAVGGMIGAAVLVFAVFATVTLIRISNQNVEISEQNREISKQKDTISAQYSDLQEKYAEKTALSAKQLLGKGRRDDAVSELKSVLPDSKDKPYNPNVVRLMYEVLNIYSVNERLTPVQVYEDDTEINGFDVSPDGKYILMVGDREVRVYETESKELLYEIESQTEEEDLAFSAHFCGPDGFAVIDGDRRTYYFCDNPDEKEVVTLPDEISDQTDFYSDDAVTIVSGADSLLAIGDKGEVKYRIDIGDIFKNHDLRLTGVSFEKEYAAATFWDGKYIYAVVFDKTNGSIKYKCSEKKDRGVAATVYGDTLCYVSSESSDQRDGVEVKAVAVDLKTGRKKWETELPGETVQEVCRVDDTIYARGASSWSSLSTSGELLSTIYTESSIETTWINNKNKDENNYYYLCASGDLYSSSGDGTVEGSDRSFKYIPTQEAYMAKWAHDALFYMPSNSYVVKYAPDISDKVEEIGEDYPEEDYYSDPGLRENTEQILKSVDGIDPRACDEAFFSNDKKYLCARDIDVFYIVDVEAKKLVKRLEDKDEACRGMRYSDLSKGYIIDTEAGSLILDTDFNIISDADRIVGEDDNGFIIVNDFFVYYRVPYVSYDELVERLRK